LFEVLQKDWLQFKDFVSTKTRFQSSCSTSSPLKETGKALPTFKIHSFLLVVTHTLNFFQCLSYIPQRCKLWKYTLC